MPESPTPVSDPGRRVVDEPMTDEQYESYGRCPICGTDLPDETFHNSLKRLAYGSAYVMSCGWCSGHLPIPRQEWWGRGDGRSPEKWHGSK